MYRVVSVALLWLTGWSMLLAALGYLHYGVVSLLLSLTTAIMVAAGSNWLWSRLAGSAVNYESALITALIVFFIVPPADQLRVFTDLTVIATLPEWVVDHLLIALVVIIAVSSKFLLAFRQQHLLNPAAVGVVAFSLVGWHEFTWWIGTPELFVPLLLAGAAVVQKLRQWPMVLAFGVVSLTVFMFDEWRFEQDLLQSARFFFLSYSTLFLAFFMLTEPFTTPPTRRLRIAYGVLVGFLAHTMWLQPVVAMTPELALLIGNVLFYPATLRQKLSLSLRDRTQLARDTYEFVFAKSPALHFQPGQYLEWYLPHHNPDRRGERRYFTIASSPTESVVRVAMRVVSGGGSSFKAALWRLVPGEKVIAGQRAGDFLLPQDPQVKIACVAGGIGITPFRSFAQHLLDTQRTTDSVLLYCNHEAADIAYYEYFTTLDQQPWWRTVHILDGESDTLPEAVVGPMTVDQLKTLVPDYQTRVWYLSGSPGFVKHYQHLLRSAGVSVYRIKTDFFPGLA